MSALEKLPDIVLCMQGELLTNILISIPNDNFIKYTSPFFCFHVAEHALPLMQRVFELGVNSNVNTISFINKTIALLNTQQGC